jgi:geranylgeranyl diphosphate synthase type I
MVPKLARPEFEAPVARMARLVDEALSGMRALGHARAPLWDEAVSATLAISRATSHLLRAQLVLLGSLAGGGPTEGPTLERFAAGVELLHLFMLVHDDAMDNAALRRRKPTLRVALAAAEPALEWIQAHDLSIVVGNVINVLAVRHLVSGEAGRGEAAAVELVLDGCCRAGAGQFQDLLGFRGLGDDEEALRRELVDKSAFHAFAAPFGAGLYLAGATSVDQAIAWGCRMGLAFQAGDDLADLVSSPAVTGKDNLRDLLEGRPSLPLLFLRRRATGADAEFLDDVVGKHALEYANRARLHDVVRSSGVVEATAAWAQAEIAEAARVADGSGFAAAAREGMAAIEKGLAAWLDTIVASARDED